MSREPQVSVCTFYIAEVLYGLFIDNVREVGRLDETISVPLAPPAIQGLMNLRGSIVTVINLRYLLGLLEPTDQSPPNVNVVAVWEQEIFALIVDRVGDILVIEDQQIEPLPANLSTAQAGLFKGIVTLPNQLLHLLNLESLLITALHH